MIGRWLLQKPSAASVNYLSKSARLSPLFARILINRGLSDPGAVKSFLDAGICGLSDPFELPGMTAAVERIGTAVRLDQKVLVHGDYDADGLTAAAILVKALRGMGLETTFFIPNRLTDGYGFNPRSVGWAKKTGIDLIITVDCGIVSFEAAECARTEGIDLIITDHHEPLKNPGPEKEEPSDDKGFCLPQAIAVINPKLASQGSATAGLSGAGIAFKLAEALGRCGQLPYSVEDALPLLDLAAIGTVADVVPLTGENRIIIREGLKVLSSGAGTGIRALREISGLKGRDVKAGLLSYTVVPRINAAGRLGDASDVVRLFLSDSGEEAAELSVWLDTLNTERQAIEERVYREALDRISLYGADSVVVLAGEGWHPGVVGVVASRIAEELCRPAVILSIEDGTARGSARSVAGFDICSAFSECKEMLLRFGGHKQAAGVSLDAERLPEFSAKLCAIFSASAVAGIPEIRIDADVNLSEITFELMKELAMLEPVGYGNPEPLLGARHLKVLNHRVVGKNHVKMKLCRSVHRMDAIGFDMAGHFEKMRCPGSLDVVFTPSINEWNGGRYLQLVLKAFRPAV